MTVTDELVRFIAHATPPAAALTAAGTVLDAIDQQVRESGEAIKDAPAGGAPTAMNRAWRTAICAATVDGWSTIGATVTALQHGSPVRAAEAVTATAVGTAVAEQVAAALESTEAAARWSHRNVAGLIGAGASAGRLLNLDEEALRNLIGLCATQASGLASVEGTAAGVLQAAKAASDAVEAATLARHGFTSSADGMYGRRGLFGVLAPGGQWPGDFGAGWGVGGA